MTTPSNAELRRTVERLIIENRNSLNDPTTNEPYDVKGIADDVVGLIQAREQQLIAELLDSKQECTIRNTNPKTRIMRWHSQEGEAVPVSVIERLQNKTNDGGQNGASE